MGRVGKLFWRRRRLDAVSYLYPGTGWMDVQVGEDTFVVVLSEVNGDLSTYSSRTSYYESNLLRGCHCRMPASSVKQ